MIKNIFRCSLEGLGSVKSFFDVESGRGIVPSEEHDLPFIVACKVPTATSLLKSAAYSNWITCCTPLGKLLYFL